MVEGLLDEISRELEGIPGIIGIVLGGSRARGTHHEKSDIDIGIYYDETLDIGELNKVAVKLDDEHRENLVTQIGGWGPWVNAGGWLVIQGYHVDFILRDIRRVSQVIDDCLAGKVSTHYQAGHPHGYLNVMYMGEISVCKILVDPRGMISDLKPKFRHEYLDAVSLPCHPGIQETPLHRLYLLPEYRPLLKFPQYPRWR
jgi:predicted nucleotidyltransferase